MKQLYKFVLATCILLPYGIAQGQTAQEFPRPAFHWKCTSTDSLLNFHPATVSPLHFDSIPYAEDYTVVVVYKPVVDTEATVWQLVFADSIIRGLTTERIILDSAAIRYVELSDRKPVIHTLRQSAPDMSTTDVSLYVGDGNIKVAEVLYYNYRLGNYALRRVQSTLAIRYGITLGPVDYVGGNGNHVWQHRRDSAMYHHRIIGIGNDTVCNLHQSCSHSEMDGAVVTLFADSLPQGTYILLGDNDAPLTFHQEDNGIETLIRQWSVQASGVEDVDFSLTFDTRSIPIPTDSLVLLIDDNIVLPSATATNEVRFNNLWLPSDTCTFTLARGMLLWQLAKSGAKGDQGQGAKRFGGNEELSIVNTQFSVFPNPTTGHFKIEVTGTCQVQVTIYSLQGKIMATYNDSNRNRYCFEDSLPSGNVYYATITTESGSQTVKLVVK